MPWSSTIVGVLIGPGVGEGAPVGVGSGVAVLSSSGVGSTGGTVRTMVETAVGVGLDADIVASASRSWTFALTVAPTSTVGGTGARGIRVARFGASALEQPMVNATPAKMTKPKIRCFAYGITILGTTVWFDRSPTEHRQLNYRLWIPHSGIPPVLLFPVSICELARMIESRQLESPGRVCSGPWIRRPVPTTSLVR